ncbi:MAG: hypothetical protein GY714_17460 [Desulfobacterales bacterium]|nr:hypothetical protein [Desulfobacterales bacterium]MCP4162858.1 hypothetical protein [Deltaproteobacteria bacterium]
MIKLFTILFALLQISGLFATANAQATTIKKGETSMLKQYAFFYFMKENSQQIPKLIPEHIKYWNTENPIDYSGGPFNDRSGGLILFKAKTIESAREITANDPFVTGNVLQQKWIKEWISN